MEPEKKPTTSRESGEYDLAEPAPSAPPPVSSAPDPRMAESGAAAGAPDALDAAPRRPEQAAESGFSGMRPDLELGEKAKTVRMHLACARCGKDLKDQPRDGECPTCGFEISLSLQGDRLDFSNPSWLTTLRGGGRQVFLAAILYMAAFVMLVLVRQPMIAGTLLVVGAACDVMGVLLLTTREPLMFAAQKGLTPSPLIRLLALAASAGGILTGLTVFWPDCPTGLVTALGLLTLLALAARSIPLGYYMQSIIARIPNDSAATEWMIFGWLLAGASLFVGVLYLPMRNEFDGPWGVFHMTAVTPALVAVIWYFKITRTLASDLNQSLYEALKPRKKKT